jgi:glycosyltransferase involved in cell wall biosynthesis
MKVAIIHYWLLSMRGGEKVVEALCKLFPSADIYTLFYNKDAISDVIKRHNIYTSFLQSIPFSSKIYQSLLPLFPTAIEQFNLTGYDLVISSESGIAKGVLTRPETCHICYCHTPMRYAWDLYHDYLNSVGKLKKLFIPIFMNYIRQWDLASSFRVDHFIANSQNVADRIMKHYRRESTVIYPPVSIDDFMISDEKGDFYLTVGQLVSYKKPEIAIETFNKLKKKLVVIGDGPQFKYLNSVAGPTVKLLGRQPFNVIRDHYSRCKAFIFPGEEDFGMTPVEAMASGKPVLAYAKGGALETVIDRKTGMFFNDQSVTGLSELINRFEKSSDTFEPNTIRDHSKLFNADRFDKEFMEFVNEKLKQ